MEGVRKFSIRHWQKSSAWAESEIAEVNQLRQTLYQMQLVGLNKELNLGYGNVSKRYQGQQFYITGSQTGHLDNLDGSHYSLITHYDFQANSVDCVGPIAPSSEALSHAVFYDSHPDFRFVAHIHSKPIWSNRLQYHPFITPKAAEYGSIELFHTIQHTIKIKSQVIPITIVMAGHEEGIIIGGRSINEIMMQVTLSIKQGCI
ncbi:MAG: class II aldolase/adducin family protein [Spirochaetes bacterium]|nr:class II aldolase/adducin family protein [Spirochaetota bacterium]